MADHMEPSRFSEKKEKEKCLGLKSFHVWECLYFMYIVFAAKIKC